jgi:hypothetical protein
MSPAGETGHIALSRSGTKGGEMMFKSFIAWLDSYISREEPSTILKALIGLMAFAGLLGTVFGSQPIRVGAFVALGVFVTSVILFLVADRRRLQRAYDRQRKPAHLLLRLIDRRPYEAAHIG